jgi:hypothetical protein
MKVLRLLCQIVQALHFLSGSSFPCSANIFIFALCMTSACCLHDFVIKSHTHGILKATCKSRNYVRLGNLPLVHITLFYRLCNFKMQAFTAESQVREREKLIRRVKCLTISEVRIIFIESNWKVLCFIYNDTVSVLKEYGIHRNYSSKQNILNS